MPSFKNIALLAFSLLASTALTVPVAEAEPAAAATSPLPPVSGRDVAVAEEAINKLAKRGQGIHLVNCRYGASGPWIYSVVVYCANDGACKFNPAANNRCYPSLNGDTRQVKMWEGGDYSCTFPTGVKFTWNVKSNAQSYANYATVGSGNNGYVSFTLRKDSFPTMYTDPNGNACQSVYYGLP
ncbi:hypothetical protein B0H63DRAFT_526988 [Podospora didyma]|uniref:Secreted protein n=1 Tax=Podospora didyma TaxID=330526 RepID=A0AAE0K8L6_9PEZI|nr:hypothetical protein B0H63DRAFT_526988 [Podospora didyma]